MKIKLNDLKKVGKELNALLFETEEINVKKGKEEELKEQILEAAAELEPAKGKKPAELSAMSELAQELIPALQKEAQPETEEEEEAADLTLEEQVEELDDLIEAKKLIKSDDFFKTLRKGLGLQKDLEKLKKRMLDALKEDKTTPSDEKPKQEKAEKKEKAEKAPKKPTYNRVAACTEALLTKPKTFEAWIAKANEIMEENGGKANLQESKYHCRNIAKMAPYVDFGVTMPVE